MRLTTVVTCGLALGCLLGSPWAASAGQVTQVTLSPASPVAPGTAVTVTVDATAPCGAIEINFGDGGAAQTFPIITLPLHQAHTYKTAGTFTITAKGQANCTGQQTTTLQVAAGHVDRVTVSPSPTKGVPLTVTVNATPPCGAIQINFGDGVVTTFPVTTLPLQQQH